MCNAFILEGGYAPTNSIDGYNKQGQVNQSRLANFIALDNIIIL